MPLMGGARDAACKGQGQPVTVSIARRSLQVAEARKNEWRDPGAGEPLP